MTSATILDDASPGETTPPRQVHRFLSMVRWDVKLQIRYGLYTIYAVVVTLLVLGLQYVPESYRSIAVTVVVFGDPVFLGMYFIAALVLFEKGEGVLAAMTTSPLQGTEYLLSKVLSLTFLSLFASGAIALVEFGAGFRVGWFSLGVGLTSILFVLVGFIAVSRFDTLNSYFVSSLVYMLPFGLPLVTFLGVDHPLLYVIPTHASVLLIGSAFGAVPPVEGWGLVYVVGYPLVWILVAWPVAKRSFRHHIVGQDKSAGRNTSSVPAVSRSIRGERLGPTAMLVISDLRNWLRDPLLLFVLILPVFYAVIGRLGTPIVATWLAPEYDLLAHYPLLLGFFAFVPPLTIGFVVGILVIEEKEERILEALWTTPLSGRGYLVYRCVSAVVFSFLLVLVMVPLTGFVAVPIEVLLPAAAVGSLWTVACALALPAFADNTIEGVAISKFVGFTILVPVFAIATVPAPVQYLAGAFPLFWPLKALTVGITNGSLAQSILLLLPGILSQGVVIGYLLGKVNA